MIVVDRFRWGIFDAHPGGGVLRRDQRYQYSSWVWGMIGSATILRVVGLILILALSFIAAPLAADAQQPAKVARIGLLLPATSAASSHLLEAFRQGLRELGYVEGKNIILERRYAEGRFEPIPDLAAELVRLKVDVIVTAMDPAIQAAKQATVTIPIVMAWSFDPVGSGLVASLARPGGNITGLSTLAHELSTRFHKYDCVF